MSNIFNSIWNFVIVISAIIILILLPLSMSFDIFHNPYYLIGNILVSLIFTADIYVQISNYRAGHEKINDEPRHPMEYFKKWFSFDLISTLPFDLLFSSFSFGLFRLGKMMRVVQIMALWRYRNLRYSSQLRLFYFLAFAIIIVHWISCGWLALKVMEDHISDFSHYFNAFYWTITTITTVGYGDIVPHNDAQKIYAMITMLIGLTFYGYLIGNIANILSKKDPAKASFLDNVEKLEVTSRYRDLPLDLQKRIYDYYAFLWKQRSGYKETDFLDGLPSSLKKEVSLHLKKDVIERIPLFQSAGMEFVEQISLELTPRVVVPGDYVFKEGDHGEEMFFVVHGILEVIMNGEVIAEVQDGGFFGEIAIFRDVPRTAAVRARVYCDLYSLSKETFQLVVAQYPDIAEKIKDEAKAREAMNVDLSK